MAKLFVHGLYQQTPQNSAVQRNHGSIPAQACSLFKTRHNLATRGVGVAAAAGWLKRQKRFVCFRAETSRKGLKNEEDFSLTADKLPGWSVNRCVCLCCVVRYECPSVHVHPVTPPAPGKPTCTPET
ncbi:hypothetical protein MHYP_G00000350 [Metynnis hypsauchen]